jgi:RNA-directed DNA polymerase
MLRSTSNAAQSVRRVSQVNQGKNTPGVDKVLVKTPEERGKMLNHIINNTTPWRAMPVKRVYIPKANGKLRPLGIPTIQERALQAIVKNALEPVWEAQFEGISYGFRPGRSAQDAISQIWSIASQKRKMWVLDADIQGCFDNINHEHLLETIGVFPAKELIRQWLKAGYVEYGRLHETVTGTPQGGIISPLLANISLHGMEDALGIVYRKSHLKSGKEVEIRVGKCAAIRYADDFVILCDTEEAAKQAQERLKEWLAVRGLQLSPEKTQIVHLDKGFDFLGFNIRCYPTLKNASGRKTLITPSKKSVNKIRERLHGEWKSLRGTNVAAIIKRLNPIIRGWANYFRTQVSSRIFANLEKYMYKKEIRYIRYTHPHKPRYWLDNQYFGKLNPSRHDKWVFGNKETGTYLHKFSWTDIQRHTMVTGKNSPDDTALTEYWRKRELAKIKNLAPKPARLAKRQKGKCPICGEYLFNEENIEQHHIMPKVMDGPNTDGNLILVHLMCHQQLTAEQRKNGLLRIPTL